jgi:diguanylate cyclase
MGNDPAGQPKGQVQAARSRQRLLLVALLFSLMSGLIGLGQPLEDQLRTVRNLVNRHPASGDIVIIGIDDRSLAEINRWPWPRRVHAALVDRLAEAGATRIFFDVDFSAGTAAEDDRRLAEAFSRHPGKVVLPVQKLTDRATGRKISIAPLPMFAEHVETGSIVFQYNHLGAAWSLPYAAESGGSVHPTFAAKMAGIESKRLERFPIDYSIEWRSIVMLSAADVLAGKVPPDAIKGRQVIVGAVSDQLGDILRFPGQGMLGGVYLHVLGAETLKAGTPIHLGWALSWAIAGLLAVLAMGVASRRRAIASLAAGIVLALALPVALERSLVFVDVAPALVLLTILAGRLSWLALRQAAVDRARTHSMSGLPTLNVLREEAAGAVRPLIVARITNYAEITASIPVEEQRQLVGQIAGRLSLGSSGRKLYHGDEGVFAWFADDEMAISLDDHLGALHNFFRSPVRVGDATIDLSITFGVEAGSERSTGNRLGSAMLAAEEAASEGQRWKLYDAERLKEAPWRLSLLSQLEEAMETGGLWVAYQPQIEVRSGRLYGAEALVRWTHPDKGPISPADFIPIAESSGRIRSLTEFVLDHALATAAAVAKRQADFGIAVNLSARLIDEPDLCEMVAAALAKHGVAAGRLTLEVTETAALGTTDQHVRRLAELKSLGVCLSIDDYGTGLSTLDYVKRLEADEIKIDRSFVQSLRTSQDDRVIVESTIRLAHSLGHLVTAEGIEDQDTLTLLDQMGCDRAQGFFIARPMPWEALLDVVQQEDSSTTMSG